MFFMGKLFFFCFLGVSTLFAVPVPWDFPAVEIATNTNSTQSSNVAIDADGNAIAVWIDTSQNLRWTYYNASLALWVIPDDDVITASVTTSVFLFRINTPIT